MIRLQRNLSLVTLLMLAPTALALSNDAKLPYHFKSDSITYSKSLNQATYFGHVHVQQGTTLLSGHKLVIQYGKDRQIEKMIDTGNLAHYSTLPDHQPSRLYAEAKKIIFYPIRKKVLLEKKAKVTQEKNVFTGPHIWYDIAADVVRTTPQKNKQTVILIQPQDQ